ncbi:MAG TPA: hypothetical protein VD927_10220 [Chryseosolibacter sp.]|nr:hypothetical protein [Chryseosolibacter sp.]
MNLFERFLLGMTAERSTRKLPIDFIRTKKQILRELQISKESGNIIGVYARAFGEGMFLTQVEYIDKCDSEEIIHFHRYDMSGHILSRCEIGISEIKMVFPFNGILKLNITPAFRSYSSVA